MGKTIFTFAGQGSQYRQMGWDLFQTSERFRQILFRADKMSQKILGSSFLEELYEKNRTISAPFDNLPATHPALFTVQYATAMLAMEKLTPDLLIGGSLGEIIAWTVSGVISFEEALEFIILQTEVFEQCCDPGVMVVVFCKKDELDELMHSSTYPLHFVVSSSERIFTIGIGLHDFALLKETLNEKGILYQKLPTNFAFHTPLIENAKKGFYFLCKQLNFKRPDIQVASAVSTKIETTMSLENMWKIVRQPVLLKETLKNHLDPTQDRIIDFSPQGSHISIAKELFGPKSYLSTHSLKTITPLHKATQNLEKICP